MSRNHLRATARELLALADTAEEAADLDPGPGVADDANWAVTEAFDAYGAHRYADACRCAMRAIELLLPALENQAGGAR